MRHFLVEGRTLPEAYHQALVCLAEEGELTECPAYDSETKECAMTFQVAEPLAEPRLSRCFIGGHHELQQYVLEVCDGILDFMIGRGEHVWEYTYHDRIKDQLPFVIGELKRDPASRRAVIDVRDNSVDMYNDHPACLQHIMFMIRHNKLDMKVLMRSNDATEATFMNAFAFICLQERVAQELGLAVGSYTHTANSFHSYKKDWELLDNYVKRIKEGQEITYRYQGFYDELMREEIPAIMSMVAEQKKKYGVD